jgi:hypothetical protein
MSSRRTSSVPKEDVFPKMLDCDSRCSQTLPGLSPALPGALLCNATHRLGDGKRVILRQRVRGSVRAVRAVRNTRVFQTETRVVADVEDIITWFQQITNQPTLYCTSTNIKISPYFHHWQSYHFADNCRLHFVTLDEYRLTAIQILQE